MNSPKTLIIVGFVVAAVAAWWVYHKNTSASNTDNAAQSQTPAMDAAAGYSVPPNIGVQTDNTGGLNGTAQGNATITYTNGAAQALPMNA